MKKNIEDAKLSLLLEIDGNVHLIGMEKETLEAMTYLIKNAVKITIPTGRSQKELREFLNYEDGSLM